MMARWRLDERDARGSGRSGCEVRRLTLFGSSSPRMPRGSGAQKTAASVVHAQPIAVGDDRLLHPGGELEVRDEESQLVSLQVEHDPVHRSRPHLKDSELVPVQSGLI